ncbi:extracellular solute-binding protein [Streptomyces sp. NPDC020917]|uniref:extracellular solute-binding protein n=1 Tax=Streptomyces sp. NPDC020917 TaxID=3365102 RepID=UPI00379CBACA
MNEPQLSASRTLSRRGLLGMATGAAAAATLAACSSGKSSGDKPGQVRITAMGMPPTTNAAARKQYLDRLAQFETANPGIKVSPSDQQWDARTFAAQLAGGTASTVLTVPMTEPAGLIQRRQVADITAEAKGLPIFAQYDSRIIAMTSRDGHVYGLPASAYSLGLAYNRELFTKAGLDPDRPPTTWDELRAAAKAITDKTGVPGFGEMTTQNTGGWHLTAETYTRGGEMEIAAGSGYAPAFNAEPTRGALALLAAMRWDDKSMGTNQLRGQEDLIRDMAAGNVGMFVSAPDLISHYVANYKGDTSRLGLGAMPQGGGNATLLGGTVWMVSARANAAQRAAAVKFIDFMSLRQGYDETIAAPSAKASAADGIPVGIPTVPVFGRAAYDKIQAAIKPYVNLPVAHYQPYIAGDAKLTYKAEPPVAAQDLYAALDNVVQAVLTKHGTDINAALSDAETKVTAALKRAQ